MEGVVRLWFLPIAILKWTMFGIHFTRNLWDGSSYSYEMQLVGRTWSPIYWVRTVIMFFAYGCDWRATKLKVQTETNIVTAPRKIYTGYIPLTIRKPLRYCYYFTTLYIL